VHETAPAFVENAEAGFFSPHEFSFSMAPSMGYVPPGVIAAGHRRPEDDPNAEVDYERGFYRHHLGKPATRIGIAKGKR
jgi:hypothetical protein